MVALQCSRRALWRAAWVLAAQAASAQTTFDVVLERARQERSLEICLNSPPSQQARGALFEAFQRRFDIRVQWKWVSLHTVRSTSR